MVWNVQNNNVPSAIYEFFPEVIEPGIVGTGLSFRYKPNFDDGSSAVFIYEFERSLFDYSSFARNFKDTYVYNDTTYYTVNFTVDGKPALPLIVCVEPASLTGTTIHNPDVPYVYYVYMSDFRYTGSGMPSDFILCRADIGFNYFIANSLLESSDLPYATYNSSLDDPVYSLYTLGENALTTVDGLWSRFSQLSFNDQPLFHFLLTGGLVTVFGWILVKWVIP